MVDSQEIIERSFQQAILNVTIAMGYTVDPANYNPDSPAEMQQYSNDIKAIQASKGFFVEVFGASNNFSKAQKNAPRIVVNPRGFFPGDVGLERHMLDYKNSKNRFVVSDYPNELTDQFIDIHLVSQNSNQNRIIHRILYTALPSRAYLKPYTEISPLKSGNIFYELVNFYDSPELTQGLLEKIYQYQVKDTLVLPPKEVWEEVPINDITVDIYDCEGKDLGDINVKL